MKLIWFACCNNFKTARQSARWKVNLYPIFVRNLLPLFGVDVLLLYCIAYYSLRIIVNCELWPTTGEDTTMHIDSRTPPTVCFTLQILIYPVHYGLWMQYLTTICVEISVKYLFPSAILQFCTWFSCCFYFISSLFCFAFSSDYVGKWLFHLLRSSFPWGEYDEDVFSQLIVSIYNKSAMLLVLLSFHLDVHYECLGFRFVH